MKNPVARSVGPAPRANRNQRAAKAGLRTGRIHAGKASATEIRKAVGVTQADERLGLRALAAAAASSRVDAK